MKKLKLSSSFLLLLLAGLAATLLLGARAVDAESSAGPKAAAGSSELISRGIAASDELSVLFLFSGVTDDGEQGSASRREATSIHCTNIGIDNTQVEVQVYQWNGTDVYTGTVNMPPNRTFTYSTQNTTIYFDDVILGGSPGTDAIFQGSGRVLADSDHVICTAQTLDPLNYPPVFMDKLTLYDRNGIPVDHTLPRPDLVITKTVSITNPLPGQPITYTLDYANLGTAIATSAVITDIVPLTLTNVVVSSNPPITPTPGSNFVWLVGNLPPDLGGVITITGVISPDLVTDTVVVNHAVITSSTPDRNPLDNLVQTPVSVTVPLVHFSAGSYLAGEGDGTAVITVMLSVANPYLPVEVIYNTSDGTATASEDYIPVANGMLTFAPGEDTQTFEITILDEIRLEETETIILSLSSPDGAAIGAPSVAELAIHDDDVGVYLPVIFR